MEEINQQIFRRPAEGEGSSPEIMRMFRPEMHKELEKFREKIPQPQREESRPRPYVPLTPERARLFKERQLKQTPAPQ